MFDISWTEFLLIGIVALIVIGPKELPAVMRTMGQWARKIRIMAGDFQNQFHEAMREADVLVPTITDQINAAIAHASGQRNCSTYRTYDCVRIGTRSR